VQSSSSAWLATAELVGILRRLRPAELISVLRWLPPAELVAEFRPAPVIGTCHLDLLPLPTAAVILAATLLQGGCQPVAKVADAGSGSYAAA
jgi:hypothetical protein